MLPTRQLQMIEADGVMGSTMRGRIKDQVKAALQHSKSYLEWVTSWAYQQLQCDLSEVVQGF